MSGNLSFDLINKRIRLETMAPSVLGLTVSGRLTGILDPATARLYDDIYAKHAQVYPYLDSNHVPNNAAEYNYIKIERDGDGATVILGATWIKENSITVLTSTKAIVEVTDIEPSDESRLKAALLSNGFTTFTIKYRDN